MESGNQPASSELAQPLASSPAKSAKLVFHVPPDAGPNETLALLNTLAQHPSQHFASFKQLSALAAETYGVGKHANDAHLLAQMSGLLLPPHGSQPITLTPLGQQVVAAREERQVELIHYLLYVGWDEMQPERNGPLWTYRTVCNLLWAEEQGPISSSRLIGGLALRAEADFANSPAYQQTRLSVSSKTVSGVTRWLAALQPPAVQAGLFSRRPVCSRALLLLAIAYVYRDALGQPDQSGRLVSAELLLSRERREALCQLCLLEPATLDRLLDSVIGTYPAYLSQGTRAGTLGRFLRLLRLPRLTDVGLLL